jgi:hypothetical protein
MGFPDLGAARNAQEENHIKLLLDSWDWSKGIPDLVRDPDNFAILGLIPKKITEEHRDYDDGDSSI